MPSSPYASSPAPRRIVEVSRHADRAPAEAGVRFQPRWGCAMNPLGGRAMCPDSKSLAGARRVAECAFRSASFTALGEPPKLSASEDCPSSQQVRLLQPASAGARLLTVLAQGKPVRFSVAATSMRLRLCRRRPASARTPCASADTDFVRRRRPNSGTLFGGSPQSPIKAKNKISSWGPHSRVESESATPSPEGARLTARRR